MYFFWGGGFGVDVPSSSSSASQRGHFDNVRTGRGLHIGAGDGLAVSLWADGWRRGNADDRCGDQARFAVQP